MTNSVLKRTKPDSVECFEQSLSVVIILINVILNLFSKMYGVPAMCYMQVTRDVKVNKGSK